MKLKHRLPDDWRQRLAHVKRGTVTLSYIARLLGFTPRQLHMLLARRGSAEFRDVVETLRDRPAKGERHGGGVHTVGTPPCNGCDFEPLCNRQRLSCSVFNRYVERGAWREAPRKPTRAHWDRLYGHSCAGEAE